MLSEKSSLRMSFLHRLMTYYGLDNPRLSHRDALYLSSALTLIHCGCVSWWRGKELPCFCVG